MNALSRVKIEESPALIGLLTQSNLFSALSREFHPIGIIENLLTHEVARRAAQVHELDRTIATLESQSAEALANILQMAGNADGNNQHISARLTAPDAFESILRQSFGASKAMIRALQELQKTVATRQAGSVGAVSQPDPRFASEADCCIHLLHRFRNGDVVCRRCLEDCGGSWVAARRCWQCTRCHSQTCIRFATIMARSHIPLPAWFLAIRIILLFPTINATDLGACLGIHRAPTVRAMKHKIRSAIDSDQATRLLAGLDEIYLPAG